MRKASLLVLALLAVHALADGPAGSVQGTVTDVAKSALPITEDVITIGCGTPCREEPPATQWELPSCADYSMNSSLIESAGSGDRSAIDLLQRRYEATLSWSEKARIAAALLGRIPNDAAIWKEIEEHAENYLRFREDGEETEAKLQAWCAERGYDPQEYFYATSSWFESASSDRRSRPLLLRAISSKKNDVVFAAIYGFANQRDESALPLIKEALERFPDNAADMAYMLLLYHSEAADQLAMQYVKDEDAVAAYRADQQQP